MGVRAWVAAGLVAVVAFVVYDASSVKTVSDSRWTLPAAISLVRHGDLDVEEYRPVIEAEGGYGVRHGGGRRLYNYFPYGTSLLVAPVAALGGAGLEERALAGRVDETEQTIASAVVALAVAVVFLVALEVLGGSLALALVAAAVFGLGTAAWSTASRALWMHGPYMLLLAVALLLALWSERRPWLAGLTALPLGFAVVVRPTAVAAVVCFGAWVVWQRRRAVVPFVAIGAVVAVAFGLANQAMFGSWLHPYYEADQLGKARFFEALAGNLVSPARGLFVFAPVLLLAFWRRRRLSPLEWAAAGTVVLHLLLVSRFQHWWGGFSFGPRLMSDTVPLLVFLLLPFLGALRWRSVAAGGFGALFAASVFVNARGATDFDTWRWNSDPVSVDLKPSRLWDWSDPQFLR